MKVIPCEYRCAVSIHSNVKLFWVKVWLLFDNDGKCQSFFHQSEFQDACFLASELGINFYPTSIEILCSPDFLSELYNKILDYELSNSV